MLRTMTLALFVFATGVVLPATAVAQEESSFSFTSQEGDYIGGGQSRSFTPDTASFQTSSSQENNHVGGHLFPFDGGVWFFEFAAPDGQPLVPGVYEGATRWPFQASSVPGLSISGDGRGCNTLTGRFEVLEAVYGPLGYVERFHATFEQHCEGAPPALFGEVRIVNPPPPPALTIDVVPDDRGTVDRFGTATLTGIAVCSKPATLSLHGVLRERLNRFALASGNFSGSFECSATAARWSIEVTPVGDVPFGPGMATVDLTASGFDENYGSFVRVERSGIVRLRGGH